MKQHGWKGGEPWAIPVTLPKNFDPSLLEKKTIESVGEWKAMGVAAIAPHTLPQQNLDARIIEPLGGPVFMIFNNFNVIMKWNRSTYYAGTVGYMAEKVCNKIL